MTQFTTFVRYYRPYRRLLLLDLLCALIAAAATLLLPLAARAITEQVTGTAPADAPLIALTAFMLGLVGIQTAAGMVVDYHGHRMGALIESDMRADLFAHYQRLPFAFHDEQKTGQLMARITSDLFAISELAHHGPEDFAIAVVKALGAFAILFAIDAALTVIVFAFLPVMAAYAFFFHRRMMQALRRSYERIADINAQVEDTLAGIRVVQSFTNTGVEQAKFTALNQRFVDSRSAGYRSETFFSSGLTAFTELITLAVIAAGGAAIASGRLNAADLVTFLLCVAVLVDPIQRAINLARLLQEGATGFSRFTEMLAVQPTITDAPDAIALTQVRGEIVFDRVSFRYKPELPDVLSGVDLTIRAGEYVALVGSSGVGKTTLCALIPRFYDVTSGAIRIDGHDVRGVTLASLRQAIGIVQQDVYLFAGTVIDNLRYGRLDATDAEIMTAAQLAHAHDFIMALPHGYATDIGQRGVKLSGGQKQRLSIARALLKDPPILIFDEATSALDADSERAVQDALETVAHGRTLIVIAHRPSTIARAGRVLALTDTGLSEVTPSALPEP